MIHAVTTAAYIDPGTGSMLFTLVVGLLGAGYFALRSVWVKIKFFFSGGRASSHTSDRNPYVIFSDDKRYWNVFKPICDEFERRGIKAAYWTESPDDPALAEDYSSVSCEFIGEGNKGFARLNTMSADICLATTPGLDVYQWKRSKGCPRYVHVLHSVDTAAGYRMFGLSFYDDVLLTGNFQADEIRELEDLQESPAKQLEVVGCTYLDTMAERVAQEGLGKRDGTKATPVVLLAPSWGSGAILNVYGERIIQALVETGYEIIVRPHPQTAKTERNVLDPLMKAFPDGEKVEWNFDVDNLAVLARADVLITDFSAVVYDFALIFDRPVIYAEGQFDPAEYDAAWLDHPLRKFEHYQMMGLPLTEDMLPRMKDVIDEALADETLKEGRQLVRDEVWQKRGGAAARIVDHLVDLRAEVLGEANDAVDADAPAPADESLSEDAE